MAELREIFLVFLRLGTFGFGGPIAAMAMMEEEVCGRRAWLTSARFNEIYAICKVLPGPVATQMAIFLGKQRAGRLGGVAAGVAFILPAFLIVLGLSYGYTHMGWVEGLKEALHGMQIAALAVIVASAWQLGRAHRRSAVAWGIVLVSTAVVARRPDLEVALILGFGLAGVAAAFRARAALVVFALPGAGAAFGASPVAGFFATCFKAGFVVFGSGLAIIPLLEHEVVATHGWLTHAQFMDGLVIGQVTPGPVLITTTFVGFILAGFPGALLATVGTFLPGFLIVLFVLPMVWKSLAGTPAVEGFTRFAIPAVIGGILGASWRLGAVALQGEWPLYAVFGLGLLAAFSRQIPTWLLIPAGGVGLQIFNAMSHV